MAGIAGTGCWTGFWGKASARCCGLIGSGIWVFVGCGGVGVSTAFGFGFGVSFRGCSSGLGTSGSSTSMISMGSSASSGLVSQAQLMPRASTICSTALPAKL